MGKLTKTGDRQLANAGMESEEESKGASMAPPAFQLTASAVPPPPPAQRKVAGAQGVAQLQDGDYPWTGKIANTWSAALRSSPKYDASNPHQGTIADLPQGTPVKVVGKSGGWLKVEVTIGGKLQSGYVSQELVSKDPAKKPTEELGKGGGKTTTDEKKPDDLSKYPPEVQAVLLYQKYYGSGGSIAHEIVANTTYGSKVVDQLRTLLEPETLGVFARYLGRTMKASELSSRFDQSTLLNLMMDSKVCAPDCWEKAVLAEAVFLKTGIDPFHADDEYAKDVVPISKGSSGERVIVVGSEEHYEQFGTTWRDAVPFMSDDRHNKLMFMEQALSKVQAYQKARTESKNKQEKITILVFASGYTVDQLKTFKADAKGYGADEVIYLTSAGKFTEAQQLVNYVNHGNVNGGDGKSNTSKKRTDQPIYNMDFFAHGLPGEIAFGYDGARETESKFTEGHAKQLSPEAFGEMARVISYACRSGIGVDGKTGSSIAQSIADNADVLVYAYQRRSNYSKTFNDGAGAGKTLTPAMQQALIILLDDKRFRSKIDGILYDSRGAAGAVTYGGTPEDLPSGRYIYSPSK